MNTRRSFLGQILGTIVSTQLPFIAETPLPTKVLSDADKRRELRRLSRSDLLQCKGIYRLANTEIIKTTKIIDASEDYDSVSWVLEPWEAIKSVQINMMGICLPDGKLLGEGRFANGAMYLDPEDIVKGTYTLNYEL